MVSGRIRLLLGTLTHALAVIHNTLPTSHETPMMDEHIEDKM
jgi:hypothetical protein